MNKTPRPKPSPSCALLHVPFKTPVAIAWLNTGCISTTWLLRMAEIAALSRAGWTPKLRDQYNASRDNVAGTMA